VGLAGVSLGRELRALALSHTASVRRGTAPENSVTNSRADCALTQQMIGCIKAISPCVKSASAKLFPDLHTMSAPSGEERRTSASAQVERARWCCRRFDSGTHARSVAMPLSWSWSHLTHCAKAASASHPCELHCREMVRRGDGP
jgi:hypothetical protein